jgi:hypothetical protein
MDILDMLDMKQSKYLMQVRWTMRPSDYLKAHGLEIQIDGYQIHVSPKEKIAPETREYIRLNKMMILDEFKGKNTGHADSSQDPFQVSGEAVKVFFPILKGDVWLCSDAQARERVKYEGIPCFTFEDLQYIHQGHPGAERRARLQEVYAKRHPTTERILDLFHGKVTSIKVKGE